MQGSSLSDAAMGEERRELLFGCVDAANDIEDRRSSTEIRILFEELRRMVLNYVGNASRGLIIAGFDVTSSQFILVDLVCVVEN